jgi:hypothetical protein
MQQVAGLSQMTGEFMQVKPLVIDLGWGNLKSALMKVADAGKRKALLDQYVAMFRNVEADAYKEAQTALKALGDSASTAVAADEKPTVKELVDEQMVKLARAV